MTSFFGKIILPLGLIFGCSFWSSLISAASGDFDFLRITLITEFLFKFKIFLRSSLWPLEPFGFKFTKFALRICKFWFWIFCWWVFLSINYLLGFSWKFSGLPSVFRNLNVFFGSTWTYYAILKVGLLFFCIWGGFRFVVAKFMLFSGSACFEISLIDPLMP